MQTITTIGLDIAKSVFQVHGVDNDVSVQPVSATPLVVYRLAFGSPRSFADVD